MSTAAAEATLAFDEIFAPTFADEQGIFWCADCSAMAAWLLDPMAASHLEGGDIFNRCKKLSTTLSRAMPENASMQFIFLPIHNIEKHAQDYLNYGTSSNRMLQQLAESKAHYFREAANKQGFCLHGVPEARARRHVIMCTLTVYNGREGRVRRRDKIKDALSTESEYGLKPMKLLPAQKRLSRRIGGILDLVTKSQTSIEKTLGTVNIPWMRCDAPSMIRFCRTLLHPNSGPVEPVVYNEEQSLGSQICRKKVSVIEEGEFIKSDGMFTGTLTVDSWPKSVVVGAFSRESGDIDGCLLDHLTNGILSIGISKPSKEEVAAWLDRKDNIVTSTNEASARRQVAEDLQTVREWLGRGEHRLLDCQITLSVSAESMSEVRRRLLEVQSQLSDIGFSARTEDAAAHWMWARHLPGNFYGSLDGSLRIFRRCDLNVGTILPIYGCGRGTRTAMHLAVNQRWEPFKFYQFDHRNAYNVAVFAESGSGKSVLMSSKILDFVRRDNTLVAIIDYGGSYATTMSLLGDDARNIEVSPKKRMPMNIFAGTYRDCAPWLTDWIPMLVTNDDEKLSPFIIARMSSALQTAYRRELERNVPYKDVKDLLTKHSGKFIDFMRKRFYIEPMDEAKVKKINELKTGDSKALPVFELNYIVRLVSYTDPNTSESRPIFVPSDIDDDPREELISRYRQIDTNIGYEFAGLEEDAGTSDVTTGVYILIDDLRELDTLLAKGYEAVIDDNIMALECESKDAYTTCVRAGVQPYFDASYHESKFAEYREEFMKRFPNEDEETIRKMVHNEIESLDPVDYYDHVEGYADLQREIIFSDFIRAARDMDDEELNTLVHRLEPWYGKGMYADFFDRKNAIDMDETRLVNFDLKPMFSSSKKLVTAYLAAVLQRIANHYDGLATAGHRKMICIDEFQRFQELGPFVNRFANTVCRQARKNGYSVVVGTQYIEDLRVKVEGSEMENGLLGMFQWYFIGKQPKPSLFMEKTTLSFTARMARRGAEAGKRIDNYWADWLVYSPGEGMCEIMRSIQTPFEYWLRTNHEDEIPMRTQRVHKYQTSGYSPQDATIEAIKELAREYPRGYVAHRNVSIT